MLAVSSAVGAYVSAVFVGGLLVLGFSSFLQFCLICVPVLTFPVTLLGWWNSRTAAILLIVIVVLFYVAQVWLVGPSLHELLLNHTHLFAFVGLTVLMVCAAVLDSEVSVSVDAEREAP